MPWYVVTCCLHPQRDQEVFTDAVFIEAENEQEAAAKGIDLIESEVPNCDPDYCENAWVSEVTEPVAYSRVTAVERAELQCCGGGVMDDGHTATCPHHRETEREAAADIEQADVERRWREAREIPDGRRGGAEEE